MLIRRLLARTALGGGALLLLAVAAAVWLAIYWAFGVRLPATLPLGYQVASAALLIANYAGAGTTSVDQGHVTNILVPASGALAGGAVISLAVAIPLTIAINRASPKSAAPQSGTTSEKTRKPSGLHCPN